MHFVRYIKQRHILKLCGITNSTALPMALHHALPPKWYRVNKQYRITKGHRHQMALRHQWPLHCHDWLILSVT